MFMETRRQRQRRVGWKGEEQGSDATVFILQSVVQSLEDTASCYVRQMTQHRGRQRVLCGSYYRTTELKGPDSQRTRIHDPRSVTLCKIRPGYMRRFLLCSSCSSWLAPQGIVFAPSLVTQVHAFAPYGHWWWRPRRRHDITLVSIPRSRSKQLLMKHPI